MSKEWWVKSELADSSLDMNKDQNCFFLLGLKL